MTEVKRLRIWVDRFGHPCDSGRHDARPIQVVPEADFERLREAGNELDRAYHQGTIGDMVRAVEAWRALSDPT